MASAFIMPGHQSPWDECLALGFAWLLECRLGRPRWSASGWLVMGHLGLELHSSWKSRNSWLTMGWNSCFESNGVFARGVGEQLVESTAVVVADTGRVALVDYNWLE